MVIPEHKSGTPCWPRLASLVGFAVLFASGIVLAFSWEVDFPEPVLTLTWIVATVAALVVVGAVWTDSRRAGLGFFRSLGRSLRGLGRFILGFFSSPEALGRFDRSWRGEDAWRSRYPEQMVTPEHKSGTPRWPRLASLVGLAVLFASGIVLAFSWEVDFPEPVLTLAWIVATVAALVVVAAVWTDSRRAGLGFFRSVGRSLRGLGRFILDFF